ncbi:hypothetical protein EJ110_NYTH08837 [Nymphaea thermarum]|nr:hypothetical protein EJ110_NYTH08837 [Nymphaea thermarum]
MPTLDSAPACSFGFVAMEACPLVKPRDAHPLAKLNGQPTKGSTFSSTASVAFTVTAITTTTTTKPASLPDQVIDSDLPILHNFKKFLFRVGMERPNLHSQKDLLLWQNTPASNIKTTDVWEVVRPKYGEEPWRKLIWFSHTQPRAQWFVWLACNDRLPTFDRQKKSGISLTNRCALCLKEEESAHHIMVSCPHSSKI